MPNQPKTPLKCFRIPERDYQWAKHRAEAEGSTLSAVVREFVAQYAIASQEGAAPNRGHASCQHEAYRLTCDDYDGLLAEADGKCQRCGKPRAKLEIDHDHRFGYEAVRGLLCGSCNKVMIQADAGRLAKLDEQTVAYLRRSWHLRKPQEVTE